MMGGVEADSEDERDGELEENNEVSDSTTFAASSSLGSLNNITHDEL